MLKWSLGKNLSQALIHLSFRLGGWFFYAATLSLILFRNLHFIISPHSPLDSWIGERMGETFWFYVALIYDILLYPRWKEVLLFLGLVLLLIVWLILPLFRSPSPNAFAPASLRRLCLFAGGGLFLLLSNILVDAHPWITISAGLLFAPFLLLFSLFSKHRIRSYPLRLFLYLLPLILGAGILVFILRSARECLALLGGSFLFFLLLLGAQFFQIQILTREMIALSLILILVVNVLSLLPFFPNNLREEAVFLGSEPVYPFCENAKKGIVFAGAPGCRGDKPQRCKEGKVLQYERRGERWIRTREHLPFTSQFYGRIVHLFCLDSPPYLFLSLCSVADRHETLAVYNWKEGRLLIPRLPPFGGGRILYNPRSHSLYTGSELFPYSYEIPLSHLTDLSQRSLRFIDFSTYTHTRTSPGATSTSRKYLNDYLKNSYITEIEAWFPQRNTGFWGEYVGGQKVIEVDLSTLKTQQIYRVNNGGVHSLMIDEEYERLVVAGIWGIEVINLKTGAIEKRIRTELAPRLPILDRQHNLIYLTCTYGSHLWIFDRVTLRNLARVPIGVEARYALLTQDGEFLFLGTGKGHFVLNLPSFLCTHLDRCKER